MAPRIYHLHPLAAGPLARWDAHFAHIAAMAFDHACVAPVFAPEPGGDIFVTADHESLHPALQWTGDADSGVARIVEIAQPHRLRLMLDVTLGHVAAGAAIRAREAHWFSTGFRGGAPDPRGTPHRPDAAYARFQDTESAEGLFAWWFDRLGRLVKAGVRGFRFLEPDRIPPAVWRRLVAALREIAPDCLMLAWTPGAGRDAVARMQDVGFDRVCASVAWWDGRSPWLLEEMDLLRRVAPCVASPEPSFADRLASRLPAGINVRVAYAHALRVAAAVGSGMFVPMGFEYATHRVFDAARASPADFDAARAEAPFDMTADIAAANELVTYVAALDVDGALRALSAAADPITALLRCDSAHPRDASRAALVLINPDLARPMPLAFPTDPLPPQAGVALSAPKPLDAMDDPAAPLASGEVRILSYTRAADIIDGLDVPAVTRAEMSASRIGIEAISPAVPDGDFAVKRVVGETVTVSADIVADGHSMLAAALLWRPADATSWQRVPMQLVGNDRWEASFTPSRVGPYRYTVEAWWDVWGTFRHDLHAKHEAGQTLTLEIEEGRRMLAAAADRADKRDRATLRRLLDSLARAEHDAAIAMLLSDEALAAMQATDEHAFGVRHAPPLRLDADRPAAMFASWYELFPRSVTDDPHRHGTFNDVIGWLPAIAAMGFDVLYFPPIHPIGHTNRKGRNNALRAGPDDVGSPYAIGSEEGGHDAIHPQLGTLEDFRRLLAAAKENGLEIALDFAIQCSPDHPWLKQHPNWFLWRPDGSLRYAENPPKKYEDIVNPDFYTEAALPGLWHALRDAVEFWVDQGVRILRVDNPHTKPMPFWRWMIADIRSRHPDVLFLAEAFTRPKVMYRLAKEGFTQSYTYFTWRNSKAELVEYLTELNEPPVSEFFRPNFFVNTPDINPPFVQTGGRAAFLIRAVLATTLSGLWGMYSGFEICESAPLPGREEYLDAEKYEIRVRDFAAPGNIVGEITTLNRLRREHAALQTHFGVTFYQVANDAVLLYGKRVAGSGEMILVAVNLDPHAVQETDFELPLWEFGLPDRGAFDATDLMRGNRFTWQGKQQHVRLDPADMPFAIWQLSLPGGVS
ncbi:MAG TPA: maltotransferase domain-containing protein [Acetobacteraceae bacterium]